MTKSPLDISSLLSEQTSRQAPPHVSTFASGSCRGEQQSWPSPSKEKSMSFSGCPVRVTPTACIISYIFFAGFACMMETSLLPMLSSREVRRSSTANQMLRPITRIKKKLWSSSQDPCGLTKPLSALRHMDNARMTIILKTSGGVPIELSKNGLFEITW